jgi:hypothetical protein
LLSKKFSLSIISQGSHNFKKRFFAAVVTAHLLVQIFSPAAITTSLLQDITD